MFEAHIKWFGYVIKRHVKVATRKVYPTEASPKR